MRAVISATFCANCAALSALTPPLASVTPPLPPLLPPPLRQAPPALLAALARLAATVAAYGSPGVPWLLLRHCDVFGIGAAPLDALVGDGLLGIGPA